MGASHNLYRGRHAASIENDFLRVTVLAEGGHIAEIFDKQSSVNPLWTPLWPSIEPSQYRADLHPEYGTGGDASLLAGIMGHNLCLDLFGGPSPEEVATGIPAHGEMSVAKCELSLVGDELRLKAYLPGAQLRFERCIQLQGRSVRIREGVENLSTLDRPIAWTQHVTLGPPFVESATTHFRASATRSKVFETQFGTADYMRPGAEFEWPLAGGSSGGSVDLRLMGRAPASAYTTHLMDAQREHAFFTAYSPTYKLALGYIWKRTDFPWLGIWEENHSRLNSPWSGRTLVRGMEFGVSPFPESRRAMIDRGKLFGVPTYRWLPARSRADVEYWAFTCAADFVPETAEWPNLEST